MRSQALAAEQSKAETLQAAENRIAGFRREVCCYLWRELRRCSTTRRFVLAVQTLRITTEAQEQASTIALLQLRLAEQHAAIAASKTSNEDKSLSTANGVAVVSVDTVPSAEACDVARTAAAPVDDAPALQARIVEAVAESAALKAALEEVHAELQSNKSTIAHAAAIQRESERKVRSLGPNARVCLNVTLITVIVQAEEQQAQLAQVLQNNVSLETRLHQLQQSLNDALQQHALTQASVPAVSSRAMQLDEHVRDGVVPAAL